MTDREQTKLDHPAVIAFDNHRKNCDQCRGTFMTNNFCAIGKTLYDAYYYALNPEQAIEDSRNRNINSAHLED